MNYKIQNMPREKLADLISLELFHGNKKVFLTGGAGTGKSTLVKELLENYTPIMTSTTGVSALQIDGQTAHSFFKLGIASTLDELKSMDQSTIKKFRMHTIRRYLSKMIKAIAKADFIVIDEVSMLNVNVMEMIKYRLEQSGYPNKPILFTGDLLQLPPVQGESILESKDFRESSIFNLNSIYRTNNKKFIEFSTLIRMGEVTPDIKNYIESKRYMDQDLTGYVQIFPTVKEVQSQNNQMLAELKTESKIYTPEINKKGSKVYQREIDAFMENAKITQELELKVGAQIILTRNSVCENYVNGDVAIIEKLNDNSISIKLDRDGTTRLIEYVEFENIEFKEVNGSLKKSTKYVVKALPVMLGWAITIHKSQGAGIEKLYIRTRNLFAQSQFYVAISRSSNPDNLIIDYEDQRGLDDLLDIIPYINRDAKKFYEELNEGEQYA